VPVLVMVTADKIELLRDELGADAERVHFADMGVAGRNPGRIISAWGDFAVKHGGDGRRLRGIGEPIWAARDADELVECQHHESLINLAFRDAAGFRLMCPYDTTSLPWEVIQEALRSHPLVLEGEPRVCTGYHGVGTAGPPGEALPPPDAASVEMTFKQGALEVVRRMVRDKAMEAGLSEERAGDLVVGVNEAATNSVRYAGGEGLVRAWRTEGSIVCEIRDGGQIEQPLVGRRRPVPGTSGGHGLWLAHQLCDLVQLRSRRGGTVVRLHMRLH
jgi:anti-sigma regulatory factor (Ser/Thr protein kinase)